MKKIFYISALALTLSLSACAPTEVDDLFDESAAERLSDAVTTYTEYFLKDGGHWHMQYFANADEEGFNFLMTFNKDGSVKISGKNDYVNNGAFTSDVSLWQIVTDYGPVLTFNTFNKVFHVFSSPEDIPQTAGDEQGKGHEGDYEFIIISTTPDQAVLRGKKSRITIIMNRIGSDVDDQEYFNSIDNDYKAAFSDNIPLIIMTTGSGLRYICEQYDMAWYLYPETGNPIDNLNYMNAIFTGKTIRFMEPLDFLSEFEPDQVPVQVFELQDDGTYLSVEDGVTRISAPPLAYVFLQYNTTRKMPREDMTGDFATIYDNLVEECKNNSALRKPTFREFRITYYGQTNDGKDMYNLYFESNRNKGNIRMLGTMVNDNTVKFSFDESMDIAYDTNGKAYYTRLESLQQFVALLTQGEFTIEAESAMNPNPMMVKSTTNPNNTFKVKF